MMELLTGLAVTLGFAVIAIVLMGIGAMLVDVATPGSLRHLVWAERNANAAVVLGSTLAAVATIAVAAVRGAHGEFGPGLAAMVGYGLLGLLVMTAAFVVTDLCTPGRLGELLVRPEPQPAVWVTAVVHLAVGAVIAVAL
ncbi:MULTISPECIES: DUF350 domain-containing protein [Dactylosporangium]|nr:MULTISPECIES: DUF350 domain-containing protein [Dactylosporangium]UAC02095.1 DUF350 domain-containing protein [Dactylosporangium vinaceum]UWZ49863.1 DUF350 domain-containing protein [Dactylosporangium matsuzakiense]